MLEFSSGPLGPSAATNCWAADTAPFHSMLPQNNRQRKAYNVRKSCVPRVAHREGVFQ